jgi:hypothetical protein
MPRCNNPLDSNEVLKFAQRRKKFSTKQVADHFQVGFQQAAAGIAILRIKEVLERGPASTSKSDRSSRWVYVGA